ncbi:uncharacterized protein G2W53_010093 [Senna tora]|uniref:Uncharacterized protein n=1 Tax=Senna tora TaxID=362788 RepID=A0A834WZJ7_9FABA|nr:uncharacterized protein G2W53_010093 [Senna tora]
MPVKMVKIAEENPLLVKVVADISELSKIVTSNLATQQPQAHLASSVRDGALSMDRMHGYPIKANKSLYLIPHRSRLYNIHQMQSIN